jgi:hypothetical protein
MQEHKAARMAQGQQSSASGALLGELQSQCLQGRHPSRTASIKDGIHKDEIQSTASNLSVCKDGMWRMSV